MFSLSAALGHFANLIYLLGYAVKDVYWLRFCLVAGSVCEVAYSFGIADHPLWVNIFWATVGGLINTAQLIALQRQRKLTRFSEEEQALFQTVFKNLSIPDYRKLLDAGVWKRFEADEVLAQESRYLDTLYLIYHGAAAVVAGGNQVAILTDRSFIGEMSLLTEKPASATVQTLQPTHCLTWTKAELIRLLKSNASLQSSMQTVFSMDLVSKLASKSESADLTGETTH
jgi:CRP-like cAMP-binding protein